MKKLTLILCSLLISHWSFSQNNTGNANNFFASSHIGFMIPLNNFSRSNFAGLGADIGGDFRYRFANRLSVGICGQTATITSSSSKILTYYGELLGYQLAQRRPFKGIPYKTSSLLIVGGYQFKNGICISALVGFGWFTRSEVRLNGKEDFETIRSSIFISEGKAMDFARGIRLEKDFIMNNEELYLGLSAELLKANYTLNDRATINDFNKGSSTIALNTKIEYLTFALNFKMGILF